MSLAVLAPALLGALGAIVAALLPMLRANRKLDKIEVLVNGNLSKVREDLKASQESELELVKRVARLETQLEEWEKRQTVESP